MAMRSLSRDTVTWPSRVTWGTPRPPGGPGWPLLCLSTRVSLDADRSSLVQTTSGEVCCSETWEEAYQRFETPEEECRKFLRRLKRLGADDWPRDAAIVE